MDFQYSKKSLGVLVHPTSLPGGSYCGTFGDGLKKWIDILANNNISTWQFLPLSPTDCNGSPYSSPSSFALSPWFLDLAELEKNNFIRNTFSFRDQENNFIRNTFSFRDQENNTFDFKIADKLSIIAGDLLFESWPIQPENRKNEFNNWCSRNKWVEDYSIFMALKGEFEMKAWWSWPKEFRNKNYDAIQKWLQSNKQKTIKLKLIQWHLDRQWQKIKAFAKCRNITLIGDLPFYVSRDSVDVWSCKNLFSITKDGDLIFQSGVPPDYFSSTGQLWGTPTYYWAKHERTNFKWWKNRFKRQFDLVDVLRLDHFRALAGYWRVDGKAKNAISGQWIRSPGKKLLNTLKDFLNVEYLPIIAEDLGVITDDVHNLREKFGLPGMKILQFAFDGNDNNPYLPINIAGNNWVVYTGTHDNSTTISWWNNLEDHIRKDIVKRYGNMNDPSWYLIEMGIKTSAKLFIAPIQDILCLDDDSRFNTPGTIGNNWKWRINIPIEDVENAIKRFSLLGKNNSRT